MKKSILKLGTLAFLVAVLPYSLVKSCRASVTHEDSGAGCKSWEEKRGRELRKGVLICSRSKCVHNVIFSLDYF